MSVLNSKTRPAKSGKTDSVVIFVHGYGADGNDLISLGDVLAEHLPNTAFFAPDAPNPCGMNPMGYEWFPIPWLDGSSEEQAMEGMASSVDMLNDWLDETLADQVVTAERCVLVGFSQGTMMSLHIAPRRPVQVAGVVGFSGRLLTPETLAAETVSKPPILLVHGDRDDVVPPQSMPEAAEALTAAGFEVRTHVSQGMAHGIAPDGLGLALQFIKAVLG